MHSSAFCNWGSGISLEREVCGGWRLCSHKTIQLLIPKPVPPGPGESIGDPSLGYSFSPETSNSPLIWSLCSSDQQLTTLSEDTFQGSAEKPLAQALLPGPVACKLTLPTLAPPPLPATGHRGPPPAPAERSRRAPCTPQLHHSSPRSLLRPFAGSVVNFAAKNRTGSREGLPDRALFFVFGEFIFVCSGGGVQ